MATITSMTMAMSDMTMTSASASAAAATGSTVASMGGMDMGPGACKISMTWNWYTVGACFISQTWQIKSPGMFAGSCIGVICLVISLEGLRRLQREYDRHNSRRQTRAGVLESSASEHASLEPLAGGKYASSSAVAREEQGQQQQQGVAARGMPNRLILVQRQLVRALIHALQFGVAYFIMLLAMYYNGYIIICIIIGAFLGSFLCSWDQLLQEYG
ncbi:hypothetical protein ANO11243_055760 [Dothideomycetidae sp. 11243]|nr:hypothetical protein ANO11243_055760 [fungal sp. No.11243]